MILDTLPFPIVLAPLAGGPSTPGLAAAVADAGGLGFLAAGYLSASELEQHLHDARARTRGLLGVNVFAPGDGPADPAVYRPFVDRLTKWPGLQGIEPGEPRYSDDDWDAKLDLLVRERPPVLSFTFGCPERSLVQQLRESGSEVWLTVTSPEEAVQAQAAGADALIVQGAEAGGHRASFIDRDHLPLYGLLPLLALVRNVVEIPLVASGGIATGAGLAAALCAGAAAAQIGTAFMLCPEAGTSPVHRAALSSGTETAMTRAFTGRLARGIRNTFLDDLTRDAPIAYPEVHYATAPVRARARACGNADLVNLWAGEAHQLAHEAPAAEVVRRLVADAQSALRSVQLRHT